MSEINKLYFQYRFFDQSECGELEVIDLGNPQLAEAVASFSRALRFAGVNSQADYIDHTLEALDSKPHGETSARICQFAREYQRILKVPPGTKIVRGGDSRWYVNDGPLRLTLAEALHKAGL